ncbi:polyketide cyclase [Halobacteriales archaeon QS_9_70_65]|nr:MAG: polyketide cyclase [Halobacteriales archaeon QS_9_70_65]
MEFRRTEVGRRLVVGADVDAPAGRVWDLLVDTERWPEWGPSVAAVDAPTRRIEAGTTGRVRVGGLGIRLPFEVETFDAGAMRWRWRVAGRSATGHGVDPRADGCRVFFEVPPVAAGYAPVCRLACRRLRRLAER